MEEMVVAFTASMELCQFATALLATMPQVAGVDTPAMAEEALVFL